MKEPLHARAISLALALSVIVGGWLLFEYGNRSLPAAAGPASMQDGYSKQSATQPPATSLRQSTQQKPQTDENVAVTYKCEKGGRIRYGDQPCGKDEKTILVSASEKTNHPDRSLSQLQASVAQMEASRLEREREQAAAIQSSAATASGQDGKEMRCKLIDQAIAGIDSRLRQPHDAPTGDYYTGERKKLTDERFSIGC